MPAVLTVSPQSLSHRPSSRTLQKMAAQYELVLICDHEVAPGLIGALRKLLPRHRVVVLLVDTRLLRHERILVEEILNEGHLPVLLTTGDPSADQISAWLNANTGLLSAVGTAVV